MSTVQATQNGQTTGSTTKTSKMSDVKPEDFMKIMIQEMQQQDPFEPVSSKDLVNQVAQIRGIESNLDLQQTLKDLAISQKLSSASTMIGKQITGKDSQGTDVAGTVASVKRDGDNISLQLDNGRSLAIENIISVVNPTPATTPSTTSTTSTSSTSSTSSTATSGSLLNRLFGRKS